MDKNDLLINLISYIGNIIYYPIRNHRKKTFNLNSINQILIVAYRHGIGTFVLLIPLLKTLKKNIPHCDISLLVDSEVVAELAGNCPYINKIINKKGLSTATLLRGIKYFKREIVPDKYNLVISTIYERTSRNSFWTYFSRAPYRVSFDRRVNAFMDTHSFKWDTSLHEVENYLHMSRSIGCKEIHDALNLEVSPESINYAAQFLRLNNISRANVILGVHPGCNKEWSSKRWPLKHFIEVAERFSLKFKAKVIFFGGPDEEEIFSEFTHRNPNFILADNQKINHTQTLIKYCSIFLSNDSGLMHIAALHGIPTIAIFGPTNPKKNSPWKVVHKIITPDMKCSPCYDYKKIECQKNECMESILPDRVFQALEDLYKKVSNGRCY